jgi:predicted GIY-YIG superfamily endonuclease
VGIPSVYVLELEGGFIYVGKAIDVDKRLKDHMNGLGSKFTKIHKPTGKLLPLLGTLKGSGDGPERDETLRQMLRRGAKNVRGWRYCNSKNHSKRDLRDIEYNIRELLDLCRRCGRSGHFATGCRLTTDRLGKKILR